MWSCPEWGGRDLRGRISAWIYDVKALLMSGSANNVIARRGVIGEVVNFIQKPFAAQAMAVKVRNAR